MVLSFFKGSSGDSGLEHVVARSVAMLGDARHSFDLATTALLTRADAESVAKDVRETDDRINEAEQELRSELIVHVSVQGSSDIGSVLAFTLLLKKIERIGDQAKNILDLAEHGVSLAEDADVSALLAERQEVSALFAEAAEMIGEAAADESHVKEFTDRANKLADGHQAKIAEYMLSDEPGRIAVPRAIYYRYLRRIVANLVGAVHATVDPLPFVDYLADGAVDTDD